MLALHLHQVGQGTFTPTLLNMPCTHRKAAELWLCVSYCWLTAWTALRLQAGSSQPLCTYPSGQMTFFSYQNIPEQGCLHD